MLAIRAANVCAFNDAAIFQFQGVTGQDCGRSTKPGTDRPTALHIMTAGTSKVDIYLYKVYRELLAHA